MIFLRKILVVVVRFILGIIWIPFFIAGLAGFILFVILDLIPAFLMGVIPGIILRFVLVIIGSPFAIIGLLGLVIAAVFVFLPVLLCSKRSDWDW